LPDRALPRGPVTGSRALLFLQRIYRHSCLLASDDERGCPTGLSGGSIIQLNTQTAYMSNGPFKLALSKAVNRRINTTHPYTHY
jgi:hypothetical protein